MNKKLLLLLLSLSICFLLASTYSYASGGITENLVGYWKFDEGTGTTAIDDSGSNYNGVITGATYTEGKYGYALTFDGTDDKLNLNNILNPLLNNRTISFWIKMDDQIANKRIIGKVDWVSTWRGYFAQILSTGKIQTYLGTGSAYVERTTSYAIDNGAWHFVAITINRNNLLSIYVDNNAAESVDCSAYAATNIANTNDLLLMFDGTSTYLNATLDELRIYNRALTATEVNTLYNYDPTPTPTPTPEPTPLHSLEESTFTFNGLIVLALFIVISLYFSVRPIGTINLVIGILSIAVAAGLAVGGFLGGLWFFTFAGVAVGLICLLRGTDLL